MTKSTYQPLVDVLRNEIEAYGKLFHLLEQQRTALIEQHVELILTLSETVETHTDAVRELNKERKNLVAQFHPKGETRIISLMESMEDPIQQLFKELVREINRLIQESQRQLSRNQMLYRRALDISRETLHVLRPDQGKVPGIYKRDGYTGERGRSSSGSPYVARTA